MVATMVATPVLSLVTDNSGSIDAIDFAIYRQYLLGMVTSLPANADIDKDGEITSIDFGLLRQHLLGIIELGPDDNSSPSAPNERNAFTTIEAEEYNSTNSSTIELIGTGNGGNGLGYIENGDHIAFKNVDFGSGANSFKARVAYGGDSSTTIQLRLGSPTGTIIGSLNVSSTGWDDYTELSTSVSGASGKRIYTFASMDQLILTPYI